jgi:hypothetical protein
MLKLHLAHLVSLFYIEDEYVCSIRYVKSVFMPLVA